ncbi:hypothetical protein PF010_g30122 [Phytophthora fragariae]|nr:hypothetical protein PF003_g746 [Phytophthora fragariae]KAE8927213.1 hypothetical protein PF009_g22616 [Phytophthora fragariae]KAE8952499.1 hypothetical protein PF011_g32680 [Phytophthora fragariae]KAE9060675.1 hypothetical protein PF010_g30122 [Phytophthora fragariae]KAE9065879.1 hypothetical protein PF006_g30360 [Phytophthora fragariae]
MFNQRLKFLILHQLDHLNAQAKSSLVDIVDFMWKHRRAFWLTGHWFFIDHRLDNYSAELHADRKKECDTAKKSYKKLLDDKVRDDLPEVVLEEPGIWTFPAKVCSWIWMDKSHLNDQGAPIRWRSNSVLLTSWNLPGCNGTRVTQMTNVWPI